MIGALLAAAVLGAAGHGVLALATGRLPVRAYGWLGGLGLCWLAGAAATGALTTVVGVLGGPTTPLPLIGPALLALAVAGPVVVLRPGTHRADAPAPPSTVPERLADAVCGVLALAVAGVTAAVTAPVPVQLVDEYTMWMLRAHALAELGSLDARVFTGVDAAYQQLDYPLFFPANVAWFEHALGRPSDAAAHLVVAVLLGATLAVVGAAVRRLAGPLAAVAAVLLVASAPALLVAQSLTLMGDLPALAFALPAVLLLGLWLRVPDRATLVAAAVLAAGAGGTKVEGLLFAGSAFVVVVALARGRRRPVLLAGLAAFAVDLPWLLYARVHGLHSYVANEVTLTPAHLRAAPRYSGQVVGGMVDRWPVPEPVPGWLVLVLALVAAALAWRAGARLLVAFVGLTVAVDAVVLWAQYLVSAGQNGTGAVARAQLTGLLDVTVYRVALVPALLIMLAVPVFGGIAAGPSLGDEVDQPLDGAEERDLEVGVGGH